MGRNGNIAAVTALILLVTACSGSGSSPTTQSDEVAVTTTSVTTTTTLAPTTTTLPPVDPPLVEPDLPQSGAAAPLWDDEAYGTEQFADTLASLAEAGAGWVTIVPTWYQETAESSVIYAEDPGRTTRDGPLRAAIAEAKTLGMRVVLKPHVDLADGGSRISISPGDEAAWFASYTEMILHYAGMAEETGVDQFVVGTELGGTSGEEAAWREVIAAVRQVFTGPITYAANHDEYGEVEFWDAVDLIGVDAYFPLSSVPTTILSDLSRSWEPIVEDLAGVADRFQRAVVFTEVGYPSQEGAAVQPYNPFYSDVPSVEEQAAALQAMIDTVGPQPWFGGFHWWMWFVEDSERDAALSYMPEGKPAADILTGYWLAN